MQENHPPISHDVSDCFRNELHMIISLIITLITSLLPMD